MLCLAASVKGCRRDDPPRRPGRPTYTPTMDRRAAIVLLIVFGTGVFLAGLELMITAVALPSILVDLADPTGASAWIELRKASWIINGYLLVYIVTMPLAGRLADLWGARRMFSGALVVFVVGSALAGAAQDLDQLIAARLLQGAGGGVLVPVGTAAASHLFGGAARPRALGVIGALTFLGMAAGPVAGAAILSAIHADAALGLSGAPRPTRSRRSSSRPGAGSSTSTSRSGSRPWCSPGPRHRAGRRRDGPGGSTLVGAFWFGLALVALLIGLTLVGSRDIAGTGADPVVYRRAPRPRRAARSSSASFAGSGSTIRSSTRGCSGASPSARPRSFRCSPAMALRPRSSAGRCSWIGSSTAVRTSSGSRSGRLPARRRWAPWSRASSSGSCRFGW